MSSSAPVPDSTQATRAQQAVLRQVEAAAAALPEASTDTEVRAEVGGSEGRTRGGATPGPSSRSMSTTHTSNTLRRDARPQQSPPTNPDPQSLSMTPPAQGGGTDGSDYGAVGTLTIARRGAPPALGRSPTRIAAPGMHATTTPGQGTGRLTERGRSGSPPLAAAMMSSPLAAVHAVSLASRRGSPTDRMSGHESGHGMTLRSHTRGGAAMTPPDFHGASGDGHPQQGSTRALSPPPVTPHGQVR